MIRNGTVIMIKDLQAKGNSAYAISKQANISFKTAQKYMYQAPRPHGLKVVKKGSLLGVIRRRLWSILFGVLLDLAPCVDSSVGMTNKF